MTHDAQTHRVLRAAWFMEQHLFSTLRADQVSAAVGGSTSELQRLFTDRYGLSLMAYQRHRRLTHAASMLGDVPIGEVALRCGYASQAAFTRAFRRQYGTSPGRLERDGTSRFFDVVPADVERLEHRRRLARVPHRRVAPAGVRLEGRRVPIRPARDEDFAGTIALLRPHVAPGDWVTGVLRTTPDGVEAFVGAPHTGLPDVQVLAGGPCAVFRHVGPLHLVRETLSFVVHQWNDVVQRGLETAAFERYRMPATDDDPLELEFWLPETVSVS